MKRDGFIFYESFRDATKGLPDEVRLAVYDALMDYALYGEVPEIADSTVAGFFKLIRPQIDANITKRENGKKGGRPSAEQDVSSNQAITEPEAEQNLTVTESEPNRNQAITEPEPKEKAKGEMGNGKAKGKAKDGAAPFRPPTLSEVDAYCRERNNGVDAKRFWDYYDSAKWTDQNGKRVRNWKQKMIAVWEKKPDSQPVKGGQNAADKRDYTAPDGYFL